MKRQILTILAALFFECANGLAVVDTIIPPSNTALSGSTGTITSIPGAATSGNFSQDRNCLTNLAFDSNPVSSVGAYSVGSYPCQFFILDGSASGTTIWSVIVTTNAPSVIETWAPPTPGLPVMNLCGTRGNAMTFKTSCNVSDVSYNGFTDK